MPREYAGPSFGRSTNQTITDIGSVKDKEKWEVDENLVPRARSTHTRTRINSELVSRCPSNHQLAPKVPN